VSAARAVAVVVAREGRVPLGAAEAVSAAGGEAIVVGDGAQAAAGELAARARWCDTGRGLRAAALTAALSPVLADAALVVLPASPDGRDLAPRLAAALDRPLLDGAIAVDLSGEIVRADLARHGGGSLLRCEAPAPAVATLLPGSLTPLPRSASLEPIDLDLPAEAPDPELIAVLEPETRELADARLVLGGGAGLAAGADDGRAAFELLARAGAKLGAAVGATRVATDAGWIGHDRQIGTTGVLIDPELYVAFGVAGASQHTGGLGRPRHIVSVNTDASSPMSAMADLAIVTDARALLEELVRRLDA
jgi:electron transfer flavoprotein alpha subunit